MPQQTKHLVGTHNLPRQLTPFVGRQAELAKIDALLVDPACRLLTLVGPGGIGKTRLAIEVAAEKLNDFAQGIFFVNLQPVGSTEFLISAIADALNFSLAGQETPQTQLFNYLGDKEMLLVLDNFEHLLGGADGLTGLLWAATNVKLLITSREALNLQEEWLYPVRGMPFPHEGEGRAETEVYDAVQLFVTCTRRVRPSFSLADEEDGVVRICQLVEGMPLALELAAAWSKTLNCAEIAAEIQRNVDFLASSLRNVPAQHRSMQAVFDQSWHLLTQDEQNAFKRLSVFRGGFDREAARAVAGASLPVLSALLDKSLLRREADSRYQVHELLRQYAAKQLAQAPEFVSGIYDLHSDYYTRFLERRGQDLVSSKQQQVVQEIAAEWENIKAAWEWAVNQMNAGNMQRAGLTYHTFCDFQGRFRESSAAFEKAIAGLNRAKSNRETRLTLALLHMLQGWNYIRLGSFNEAQAAFELSQTIYRDLDTEPQPGFGTDPLLGLALLAHIVGNYDRALKLGEEARRTHEAREDKLNLQVVYYVLGNAVLAQGNYKAAEEFLQQAYTLTQQTSNNWMMAYILSELGNVARGLGHFEQARHHYQAGFQLKETLNDPEGKASALNNLAQVAVLAEDYTEAKRLYQESVSIYQEINDRGGLATSLNGLGMAECALGDYRAARPHFQQALQITADMQFVPLTLSILIGIGDMLLQTGRAEYGLEALSLALHHPAGDRETKDRAKKSLGYFQAQLSADIFESATRRGQNANLETIIPTLQAELSGPMPAVEDEQQTDNGIQTQSLPDQSALIEPLTPREREVLQLMATGRTNQQIADELIISLGTAKWYTSEIYGKLGASNRTQAVARARELNLLP